MNYTLKESYKIKSIHDILETINDLYVDNKLDKKRTLKSYVKECYAHNVLYKLHFFRSRTADSDLDGNESKLRLIGYSVIWFFRLRRK